MAHDTLTNHKRFSFWLVHFWLKCLYSSMEELPFLKLIQEFQQKSKIFSNPKYLLNTTFIEHRNFFLSTLFLMEQKSNTIITIDKSLFFSPHFLQQLWIFHGIENKISRKWLNLSYPHILNFWDNLSNVYSFLLVK